MNNQDKQTELKRLHDLVFEGAPESAMFSARDKNEQWHVFNKPPEIWEPINAFWIHTEVNTPVYQPYFKCKNQPETFLDWTETLIKKGDL